MCGFAFFKVIDGSIDLTAFQKKVMKVLQPRGPDEQNSVKLSDDILMCHSRLAILGIDQSGSQPMTNETGTKYLLFNGEIYNYKTLQSEYYLDCIGNSDTEVLYKLINEIGFSDTLNTLNGMYSICYYDKELNTLSIGRDIAGQKPLYYGTITTHGATIFCVMSDLRCVLPFTLHNRYTINEQGIVNYKNYGFLHPSEAIQQGFSKLISNHTAIIDLDNISVRPSLIKNLNFSKDHTSKSQTELTFENIVRNSVERHLNSDVDVGLFLSGGIDSSLVASFAAELSSKPLTAFTMKSANTSYDESIQTQKFADNLKVDLNVLELPKGDELVNQLRTAILSLDEPLLDASFLPLSILAENAAKTHKVILTGDGGDELFAGYNRHRLRLNPLLKNSAFRRLVRLGALSASYFDRFLSDQYADHLTKLSKALKFVDTKSQYSEILTISNLAHANIFPSIIHQYFDDDMLNLDFQVFLPCQVLQKVDRMTMAHGIETRAPLLDKEVITYAQSLSISEKLMLGSKTPLRNLHAKRFHSGSFLRKKGFTVAKELLIDKAVHSWALPYLKLPIAFGKVTDQIIDKYITDHTSINTDAHFRIILRSLVLSVWMDRYA
jgi:asparagine synthase (glutamine-hydrolysing)